MAVADVAGLKIAAEGVWQRDQEVVAARARQPRLTNWHCVTEPEFACAVVVDRHSEELNCPVLGLCRAEDELNTEVLV
nr:hypothetical protein [Microbacterium sp. Root166]